jgi:hypothetical protein
VSVLNLYHLLTNLYHFLLTRNFYVTTESDIHKSSKLATLQVLTNELPQWCTAHLEKLIQSIHPSLRPCETFHTVLVFYGEELLVPHPTNMLKTTSFQLSATANSFAAILHIWRPLFPSISYICAMVTGDPLNMNCKFSVL